MATTLGLGGCGEDAPARRPDVGAGGVVPAAGGAGPGGSLGSGGLVGSSGGAGSGSLGSGGASAGGTSAGGATSDAGMAGADAGTCVPHMGDPLLDPTTFPECDTPELTQCGDGHCIPASLVPEDSQDRLANCQDGTKCVPAFFIETAAQFIVDTCTSLDGAEGRCLSLCVPQIAEQADFLPRDTCADTELCAPCYDPRTGEDTGACTQGCDPGPTEDPVVFDRCCGGAGSCVPTSAVPEADQGLLGVDTCTGDDRLCAPDDLASSTFVPTTCVSIGGAEGRCLPDCIPQIADQADNLPLDICETGELCAPCYDPFSGDSTGACERNGDMPTEDPVVFERCCGDQASCVPTDALTEDQVAQLGQDTCAEDELCAPDVFARAGNRAATCESLGDAEGRCIPSCVPAVGDQADRLEQGSCTGTDELCAPCFDPLSGEDTGACSQNGDAPVDPPFTFPSCCDGIGACVPDSLVPEEQQSLLGTDTCSGSDVLCAPKALTEPGATPKACRTFDPQNREGRCLAACIPQIADRAEQLLQEDCASGELCAPCYDPVVGGSTGACEVGDDAPVDPDPGPFVVCESSILFFPGVDGRCVPPHLVDPSQAALLNPHEACETGEICAPCISPLDNMPTGACPPEAP